MKEPHVIADFRRFAHVPLPTRIYQSDVREMLAYIDALKAEADQPPAQPDLAERVQALEGQVRAHLECIDELIALDSQKGKQVDALAEWRCAATAPGTK